MTGERHLDWEGCINARDLGGLATADGRHTLWGSVVRSDNPSYLTAAGWESLQTYGIRTIVALRTIGAPDAEPDAESSRMVSRRCMFRWRTSPMTSSRSDGQPPAS